MSELEMRKYRTAHVGERNFASTEIGVGIVVAVAAILAVCLWIVS